MGQSLQCSVVDCATCPARGHSVFSELVPVDINTLSTAKGCRSYKKGEMIFFADDSPSGVFCVHHGTVKIYKVGRDGKEQIIRLARGGDIIGYRSLISGDHYLTYAVPIEDTQICHIPKDTFFGLASGSEGLSTRIMTLLADELRMAEDKIVEMARKPGRERLAETLLILKKTYGVEKDQKTLSIKLTREELANIVGTAPESVSRLLSKLRQEGIVAIQGRKIAILNHDALTAAACLED